MKPTTIGQLVKTATISTEPYSQQFPLLEINFVKTQQIACRCWAMDIYDTNSSSKKKNTTDDSVTRRTMRLRPMRPMRGPDDVSERGQSEEVGSLSFWPPRVRGLFGLSAMLWERRSGELTCTNDVRQYLLIGKLTCKTPFRIHASSVEALLRARAYTHTGFLWRERNFYFPYCSIYHRYNSRRCTFTSSPSTLSQSALH